MPRLHDADGTVLCANCGFPIRWHPVFVAGRPFCCAGCAAGGPCCCTYEGTVQTAWAPAASIEIDRRPAPRPPGLRLPDRTARRKTSPRCA